MSIETIETNHYNQIYVLAALWYLACFWFHWELRKMKDSNFIPYVLWK